jgi:hypothetical protein
MYGPCKGPNYLVLLLHLLLLYTGSKCGGGGAKPRLTQSLGVLRFEFRKLCLIRESHVRYSSSTVNRCLRK